jgi:hypothetical protein
MHGIMDSIKSAGFSMKKIIELKKYGWVFYPGHP